MRFIFDSVVRFAPDTLKHLTSVPWMRMHHIATKLRDEIIVRTTSGKDTKGTNFAPYSPGYARYKRKMMAEGGAFLQNPEKVTLVDTGKMMNSIEIKKQLPNYVVIYFTCPDRAAIGFWHNKGAGRLPKRNWLNLSQKQKNWALKELKGSFGI